MRITEPLASWFFWSQNLYSEQSKSDDPNRVQHEGVPNAQSFNHVVILWYSSRVPTYACLNSLWQLIILTSIKPVCSTPIFLSKVIIPSVVIVNLTKIPFLSFTKYQNDWASWKNKPWALCSQSQRKMDKSASQRQKATVMTNYLVREEEIIQGLVALIKIYLAYSCSKHFHSLKSLVFLPNTI